MSESTPRFRSSQRRRRESTRSAAVAALLLVPLFGIFAACATEPAKISALQELQQKLPRQENVNVIVISFDALRADVLGAYGFTRRTSPHLDAFARESIVFENAYTVAPVTPTSFAAAFTGLLPTRVFHAWNLVHEDTLAVRFAAAGYRTAGFINNVQLTPERNFQTGFETYELIRSQPDERVLESSTRWLKEHRGERLFAWIHFLKPHAPYLYREEASHLYDESYDGEFRTTTRGRFDTDDPREIERIRTLYEGEVFHVDAIFGRLVDELRVAGLLENSIVAVTSDHGEEFKEHGGFQHDRLTEEHVRIPLLIYHPAVRSHLRTPVLVSNVDLFPTLLSLAGIELGRERDGRDLTRIAQEPDRIVGISMTGSQERWLSLRRNRYKLIQTCTPREDQVLYDLAADPEERKDLASERPEEVRSLHRELGAILGGEPCSRMQAAVQGAEATVGLSDENIESLKALGYLRN